MSRQRRQPSFGLLQSGDLAGPGILDIAFDGRSRFLSAPELSWSRTPQTPTFERTTVPPPVGGRSDEALHVCAVVDQSPSEHAVDPDHYRMVALRRILHLQQTELRHKGDRMSVVHFSELPRPVLPPTSPHTRAGKHLLRQYTRHVGGGGGTDITAALHAAARLGEGTPGSQQVVVLLTDGEDGSTRAALEHAIGLFPPGAVNVMSVGQPLPPIWDGLPLGSVTVIDNMARPDEVEWVVAHAIYQCLGLGWNGPATPPT